MGRSKDWYPRACERQLVPPKGGFVPSEGGLITNRVRNDSTGLSVDPAGGGRKRTATYKNIMNTKLVILTLALATSTCLLTAQDGGQRPPQGQRPPGQGGQGGMGGQRPMNPIIEALDANKDGTIDADEIAKASQALKKLDKNGDGKITQDEYRPQRPPGAGGPGAQGGQEGGQRRPAAE